jgi:histidine ammonia-lyase
MGSVSARKLGMIVQNVRTALAIEVMTAAAGLDQRAPLVPSRGVAAAQEAVRRKVPRMTGDRPLYKDIEAVNALIDSGTLLAAVEAAVGPVS